jgi:hypothetical protein
MKVSDVVLPIVVEPDWLLRAESDDSSETIFSPQDILKDSLYYPSCGFDGEPIRYLSHYFKSFVYTDYGWSERDVLDALKTKPFNGYRIVLDRSLSPREVFPERSILLRLSNHQDRPRYMRQKKPFFCKWMIFERSNYLTASHGAKRFSLIFLNTEGLKTFNALYSLNRMKPRGLALIHPGYGFGGNWTEFLDENGPFARSVLGLHARKPDYLVWGLRGKLYGGRQPPWTSYDRYLGEYCDKGRGRVLVWGQEN